MRVLAPLSNPRERCNWAWSKQSTTHFEHRPKEKDKMVDFAPGQVVRLLDGRVATIRFVGTTQFAPGEWIGVELDDATGKNDGSVQGERYFECEPGYGMFIRPTAISAVVSRGRSATTASKRDSRDGKSQQQPARPGAKTTTSQSSAASKRSSGSGTPGVTRRTGSSTPPVGSPQQARNIRVRT